MIDSRQIDLMKGWIGWKKAAFLQFRWKANISRKIITPAAWQKAKGNFRFRYGGEGLMNRPIASNEKEGIHSFAGSLLNFETHLIYRTWRTERKLVEGPREPLSDSRQETKRFSASSQRVNDYQYFHSIALAQMRVPNVHLLHLRSDFVNGEIGSI